MRVLLTSAGLETEEIKDFFVKLTDKDMSLVRALFIPVAAIDEDAVAVFAAFYIRAQGTVHIGGNLAVRQGIVRAGGQIGVLGGDVDDQNGV